MIPPVVSLADVDAATDRIRGIAVPTPMLRSAWLSDEAGAEVWLKLEAVQPTGSFKIRGAAHALARLKAAFPDTARVVTASAGNHGQAVAFAGRHFGIQARVYVPSFAAAAKRDSLRKLGADVIETATYEEAETEAKADAARTGVRYLSPYADPDVVAGAGTVAREMIAEVPQLDAVVAPVGGGGLLAGTAIVARALTPAALVIGAEAAASPAFTAALAAGGPVTVTVMDTLADGLAGNMDPDTFTFGVVRDLVDRVETTAEAEIASAMRGLIARERLIVEGATACAVAVVLRGGRALKGRTIGIILSGRNVDADVIGRVLAAGRA